MTQKAGVDEDAGQLLADRLVDQHGGHGGIDPAGQAADHLALAHLLADACATISSRKLAMVQSPFRPAILWVKLRSISAPRGVWATSGWNCTP